VNHRVGKKTIAALVPNVLGFSPGQRVRIELWAEGLEDAGWRVDFFPFEDDPLHEILYRGGNALGKLGGLSRCYKKQLDVVTNKLSADVVFIYREAALIGPALLERIAARDKPVIFDIDDPIFLPYKSPLNNWASLLKFSRKTHNLFRLSTHITAINHLIGDYARGFNPNVTVIPNFIDTAKYFPRKGGDLSSPVKLIWMGSPSSAKNLLEITAPINRLQDKLNTPLLVVGAGDTELGIRNVEMRGWSAENEVSDLQEGDVGLLPLNNLNWNNWKFFLKCVQYMSVGIPVVARKMGSNGEVIQDGVNGFLVESENDWYEKLRLLVTNHDLREGMGRAARKTVEERFSVKSQMPRVVDIFEKVYEQAQKRPASIAA
jgi:glycosyltransferase involved in cell wall biosynthesis